MEIKDIFGDRTQQQEGVWVEFQAAKFKGGETLEESVQFKIVYSNSKEPRDYFVRRLSKARRKMRRGELPVEITQGITLDMLVELIVLDWSGLEDKGKPFEYSKEAKTDLPVPPTNGLAIRWQRFSNALATFLQLSSDSRLTT